VDGSPALWVKENVIEGGTVDPLPAVTRTGYTFGGWWTGEDGDGTPFTTETPVTGAVTLYAKWTAITYTVTYDANTGAGDAMSASSHTYGVGRNLSANTYTKAGYVFAGWAESADGAVEYGDGAEVSDLADTEGAIVPLYAVWTPVPTYGITLKNNSTSALLDSTTPYSFPATAEEYAAAPTALTVKVTNTGNTATGALTASTDSKFTLSSGGAIDSITAVNGTKTFTVRPVTGLAVGTHQSTVTVSGEHGISASFNVSFEVLDDGWQPSYVWGAWPDDTVVPDPYDPVPTTPVYPTNTNTISDGDGTGIVTITFQNNNTEYVVTNADTHNGTFSLANDAISFASGFTRQILVNGANGTTLRPNPVTITLSGVTINSALAFELKYGANVVLVLADGTTNTLTSTGNPGLEVPANNAITIIGSGAVNATGGSSSAGIGGFPGYSGGTIAIGGSVQVTATGATGAAGIGGGSGAAGGATTIGGNAQVVATGGGGTNGGAGIGGGSGGAGGTISIGGNAQVMATGGGTHGTGIGGGYNNAGGTITISGGIVFAKTTSTTAAAIGAGGHGTTSFPAGKITISGGFVVAQSSGFAVGANKNNPGVWDDTTNAVIISGGSVHAVNPTTPANLVKPAPQNASGQAVYPLYVPNTLMNSKLISVPSFYATKTIGKSAARFLSTGLWTPSGTGQFPATAVTEANRALIPTAVSATLWLPAAAYTGITADGTGAYTATVTPVLVPYTDGGDNRLLE
jgi:uncharacterized repeat protein (TIGR02543 family)